MKHLPRLLLITLVTTPVGAAEIALRDEARVTSGTLVRLGDVAIVTGRDAARLDRLPLSPSPTPGDRQFVSAGAIRAMLAAQGEDLSEHRFTGAYRVRVQTAAMASPATEEADAQRWRLAPSPRTGARTAFRIRSGAAPLNTPQYRPPTRLGVVAKRAVDANVMDAIQAEIDRRVNDRTESPTRLAVKGVKLSATAARELSLIEETPLKVAFRPTEQLAPGELSVRVWPESRLDDEAFRVVAELVEQPMRAIAATPIGRGELVTTSAVRMEPVPLSELENASAYGYAAAEAIGRETKRSVRPGEVLSEANTAPPLMVRRGEEVEVVSGGGGISVRLRAIASQDGRQGDLISVEMYDTKEKFSARVVGPRRLAVLSAGSALANATRTGGLR